MSVEKAVVPLVPTKRMIEEGEIMARAMLDTVNKLDVSLVFQTMVSANQPLKEAPDPTKLSALVGPFLQELYWMLDDSEETADGYMVSSRDVTSVCDTGDAVNEALPDRPGYVSDWPGKIEYAIEQLEAQIECLSKDLTIAREANQELRTQLRESKP